MKPPIAIVGASTRAAAASAARAGFQPVTADLFADADLRWIATTTRISPYPDGFVDWLRAIEPPAWMYTGALENHPQLVDQMAWIAPLWGNPGDVLQRVRSPWELAAALRDAGLLFPETRPNADGLPLDGSWLAKSYHGASGSGVRVLDQDQSGRLVQSSVAPESPLLPLSPSPPLCFQRRIAGTPAAAVYVAANGVATLLGITQQLIGEPWLNSHGFQYVGSMGPLPIDKTTRDTIARIGSTLAEQFELSGLFGVDLVLNDEGAWTIEVNPRYTASVEIVERATGICAIEHHARACRGEMTADTFERSGRSPALVAAKDALARSDARTHAKAILFAKRDITLSNQFADFALNEARNTPWPSLADVSPAGTLIDAGRPILTLFAEGHSIENVEQNLKLVVAKLEDELYK